MEVIVLAVWKRPGSLREAIFADLKKGKQTDFGVSWSKLHGWDKITGTEDGYSGLLRIKTTKPGLIMVSAIGSKPEPLLRAFMSYARKRFKAKFSKPFRAA